MHGGGQSGGLWAGVEMKKGIYTKACAFLGAVRWQGASGHSEEVALVLTTIAYALCEKDLVAMEAIH